MENLSPLSYDEVYCHPVEDYRSQMSVMYHRLSQWGLLNTRLIADIPQKVSHTHVDRLRSLWSEWLETFLVDFLDDQQLQVHIFVELCRSNFLIHYNDLMEEQRQIESGRVAPSHNAVQSYRFLFKREGEQKTVFSYTQSDIMSSLLEITVKILYCRQENVEALCEYTNILMLRHGLLFCQENGPGVLDVAHMYDAERKRPHVDYAYFSAIYFRAILRRFFFKDLFELVSPLEMVREWVEVDQLFRVVQNAKGSDQVVQNAKGSDHVVQNAKGSDQVVQNAKGSDQVVQDATRLVQDMAKSVERWFEGEVCNSLGADGYDETYKAACELAYVFPGDLQWFRYREPGNVENVQTILGLIRKPLADRFASEGVISKQVVLAAMNADDHQGHCARMFLLLAVGQYMQTFYEFDWYEAVVVTNEKLESVDYKFYREKSPTLVQRFSFFEVCHRGRVVNTDSIYETLAVWFLIVKHVYQSHIFEYDLTRCVEKALAPTNE